ncbi:MAG: PAS domain S-box protein [Bacteroidota bacterium]
MPSGSISFSRLESLLIESCQAGTFITNLKGTLLDCNQSFYEIFGFQSKEEILKVNALEFYRNPEDRLAYLNLLSDNGSVRNYKIESRKKDNTVLFYSINSDFYTDESGDTYIIGSILDITAESISSLELSESEKRYKDLFENSLELIQSFDSNGMLLFCNKSWHDKLEYSEEDIKKLNLFDIIADEYKEHCGLMFQNVMKGQSIKNVEVEFVSKSGKRIFLEGNIVPLIKNKQLVATHGFFRDITDKSLAIKKVNEQEKILQTVFNTVPICLYIKDSKGKYILNNKMMEDTLGTNVVGKLDSQVFPANSCHLLNTTDAEAINNPEKLIRYEFDVDFNGETKQFFCGKKSILDVNKGEPILFGFSVDITDLKNSNKKIEESERILQSIINNTQGGFMLFSLDKKTLIAEIEYSNSFAKENLNLKSEKIDFTTTFNFLDKLILEKLINEPSVTLNYEWQKKIEGDLFVYNLRFSTIESIEGKPKVLVFIFDITEQKRLIQELEVNLNENKVLIGEVHHRVKNNLAIIDGILELKKHKVTDIDLQKNITDIQMRIKSIALVHQKLYQSGNFSTIKIIDYMDELSNHYKKIFDADNTKNIRFRIDINSEYSLNMNKSISLGLLLSELISNSCKYALSSNGLEIKIAIADRDTGYELSYEDSGNGLPESIKNLKSGGFGFRLIDNLIKQLKGTCEILPSKNFKFRMEFSK